MDMGMSRPYDDAPSVQPPYHGGPGSYGPGTNMGGPAGMAPPAMGPPPGMSGMSGPGPQHMGGAPPPQTHSILANLTPQQREQFQKLINSTPEQVRRKGWTGGVGGGRERGREREEYESGFICNLKLVLLTEIAVSGIQLNQLPPHVKSQVLALQAQVLGGR
jgi:hypothetical protein